jgi:hypothetical protein
MYISKTPRHLSCILHSINNYLGYDTYIENIPENNNTIDYFYRLFSEIDKNSILLSLQPEYFHLFIQYKWLDLFNCNNIFVVQDKHIYIIKKENSKWIKKDYPHIKEFSDQYMLQSHIIKSTILILAIDTDIFNKNKSILLNWIPPNNFYKLFKDKIAEAIK